MKLDKNGEVPEMNLISFNEGTDASHKAFLLFGEHAREFISPETGLHFLKKLCSDDVSVKNVKDSYSLKMILTANPRSRKRAEEGEFCLRENENGVDLNRNYEAHWSSVRVMWIIMTIGP
jgi:murein tripeptide amidase MpaA